MNSSSTVHDQHAAAPPVVAVSGIVFSILYIVSLILIRAAIPADPSESGAWLADPGTRDNVRFALHLVPFTGIAFLWFMAVLRNRIGLLEDKLLATVFLGSGLLFVAMLFVAVTVAVGLLEAFGPGQAAAQSQSYHVGRAMTYALMNTYGVKMAAIFMFITSTIGLRTAVLARWVSYTGYVLGLVMLFSITNIAWIALLFPFWVLVVSIHILAARGSGGG